MASKVKSTTKKMPSIKTLKRNCKDLWSQIVRARDQHTCQVCGSHESLQGHHCIVTSHLGGSTRYDTRNGVCLCYKCHIIMIHRGFASHDWIGRYWMKINSLVSEEIQDEIKLQSTKYFSSTNKTVHLEIREQLQKELENIQEENAKFLARMSDHL